MVSPGPSLVIGLTCSWVDFGKSSLDQWELASHPATITTLRLMARPRLWRNGERVTCVTMWQVHRAWVKWLHLGKYFYKPRYHMSIWMTPFKALYSYEALSRWHGVQGQQSPNGEGFDSWEPRDPLSCERYLVDNAQSTKGVCIFPPNREEIWGGRLGAPTLVALPIVYTQTKRGREAQALLLWAL